MANEPTQNPESAAPAAAPKAGGKIMMIAAIAGITIGAGAGALVVGPKVSAPKSAAAAQATDTGAAASHEESGGEHGEKKGGAKAIYSVENLVLNPAASGGTRFLMVAVAFELRDASVAEDMKARDAEVRDALMKVLAAKTVEQLTDINNRDGIKTELLNAVSPLFAKGALARIYLPQFVIQ